MTPADRNDELSDFRRWQSPTTKMTAFTTVVMVVVVAAIYAGEIVSWDYLVARQAELRQYQSVHPWVVFSVAFLTYVLVSILSLPGISLLSIATGWFFGFGSGVVLVSFASTTGASIAFLLCRYCFRDTVAQWLAHWDRERSIPVEPNSPRILFALRVAPGTPFFMVNALMGLTSMRLFTFWWVSQLGTLPSTIVYVYAGSNIPDLSTLSEKGVGAVLEPHFVAHLIGVFAIFGLFVFLVRSISKQWIKRRSSRHQHAELAHATGEAVDEAAASDDPTP